MQLSWLERVLYKGALKKDIISMKIAALVCLITFSLFSIIFLYLYLLKKQSVLFTDAIIFAFAVDLIITVRTYQGIIRKLAEEKGLQKENIL